MKKKKKEAEKEEEKKGKKKRKNKRREQAWRLRWASILPCSAPGRSLHQTWVKGVLMVATHPWAWMMAGKNNVVRVCAFTQQCSTERPAETPKGGVKSSRFKAPWDLRPETLELRADCWNLITESRQLSFTWELRPKTWDLRPETWDLRPETWKPKTENRKPKTENRKPKTWKLRVESWELRTKRPERDPRKTRERPERDSRETRERPERDPKETCQGPVKYLWKTCDRLVRERCVRESWERKSWERERAEGGSRERAEREQRERELRERERAEREPRSDNRDLRPETWGQIPLLAQTTFGPLIFRLLARPLFAQTTLLKKAPKKWRLLARSKLTTFGPDHFWPAHPLTIHNVKNDTWKKQNDNKQKMKGRTIKKSVFVWRRRLHTNTAYAHLWGFSRPSDQTSRRCLAGTSAVQKVGI